MRWIVVCALILISVTSYAKRRIPKPPAPITSNGVVYTVNFESNDGEFAGTLTAVTKADKKQLWKTTLYKGHTNPAFEDETTWIFPVSLKLIGKSLKAVDGVKQSYTVDIKTGELIDPTVPVEYGKPNN